ncbi:MAG: hypothetical protein AAF573_03765 [Bacteroidota bacterium]
MKKIIILLTIVFSTIQLHSQDISRLTKGKAFEIRGRLSFNSNFYLSSDNRRSPYTWSIQGNPTLKMYGITLPFSFGFRNQQFSFGTPFNVYGVSPYYKWVKLHAGFRSMNFSPYTLSGKNFFGGGVELTPGKFRLAAMHGTFRNLLAQRDTAIYGATILPSFERTAYGAKIGVGGSRHSVDLMFLKTKDDGNNIINTSDEGGAPFANPQDNIVLGLNGKITFFRRLSFQFNSAASAFTSNQNARDINVIEDIKVTFKNIIDANLSTRWGFAGDATLNLKLQNFNLGLQYKRIDPFFNSLGINFLQKDLENYTVNTAMNFLQKRLRFQGNFGLQKNNLAGFRTVGTQRLIGGGAFTFTPNRSWMVTARRTNYQRENVDGILELNDTLRLVSVTKMTHINTRYKIYQDNSILSLGGSINMQSVQDQSEVDALQREVGNIGASFSIGLKNKERGWNISSNLNYNQYTIAATVNKKYGISLRASQKLLDDKLRVRLSGNFRWNDRSDNVSSNSYSTRLRLSWKMNGKHRLNIQGNYLRRNLVSRSVGEFRGSVGYGFSF